MSETTVTQKEPSLTVKDRIVQATASLLAEGGREALSIRAVCDAAGVQAPTIYRQFGDMRGLLDAVTSYGFSTYLRSKLAWERSEDPVEDLRRGWDLHITFGLANPALYALMYGDPRPGDTPKAALEAAEVLYQLVRRGAEAGRLRVGVERAAQMIHAAGVGVTLTLLGTEPGKRDPSLSATTREAVLSAITTETEVATGQAAHYRLAHRAVALEAVLIEAASELTLAERTLLSEWLDRLSRSAVSPFSTKSAEERSEGDCKVVLR